MLSVTRDNHIKITRGDSAILQLALEDENVAPYLPTEADMVLLTVKTSTESDHVIFQKRLIQGEFRLQPGDTKALEYWQYVYDVQLIKADGFVTTVIPPSVFEVGEEVTD